MAAHRLRGLAHLDEHRTRNLKVPAIEYRISQDFVRKLTVLVVQSCRCSLLIVPISLGYRVKWTMRRRFVGCLMCPRLSFYLLSRVVALSIVVFVTSINICDIRGPYGLYILFYTKPRGSF